MRRILGNISDYTFFLFILVVAFVITWLVQFMDFVRGEKTPPQGYL